jgi:hypothetical protein
MYMVRPEVNSGLAPVQICPFPRLLSGGNEGVPPVLTHSPEQPIHETCLSTLEAHS